MSDQTVAATARWIAAVRAAESRREDRLFEDPWASLLAGDEGAEWLNQRGGGLALSIIAIRTRFFDDFLQRAAVEHGLRQLVVLGSGFDARAFRLSWPAGTRLFELDRPDVLQAKAGILASAAAQSRCERHVVGTDLSGPWHEALLESGFSPDQPSVWLMEGFLFYLPNESISHILDTVTRLSAPGSRLGFDIVNAVTLTHQFTRGWIDMQANHGAPWLGTMDDPKRDLAGRGWNPTVVQTGDKTANYGRWPFPVIPIAVRGIPRNWLVTATR